MAATAVPDRCCPDFGGNDLKTRFLAVPEFADLYATAYAALYGDSCAALTTIDQLETMLSASGLIEPATVSSEADTLRATVTQLAAAGPVPADFGVSPDSATPAAATPAGSE